MTLRSTLFLCGLFASLPVLAADAPAAAPATAAAKPAIVPIDTFTQETTFSNPKLSPDGKHIAINVRILRNGRMIPTMTIYSLPDLKVVSVIALKKFEIPADFEWLTNTRLVVTKGEEVGLREAPQLTGELVAVNIDGTKQEYLYGYDNYHSSSQGARYLDDRGYGFATGVPGARDGHVLVTAQEWNRDRSYLYDMNSNNAIRKLIADIPVPYLKFHLQNNGTPRFASGTDESFNGLLFRFDDASGKWNRVESDTIGRMLSPLAFSPDDSEVYFQHSAKGEPSSIVRDNLKTGARVEVAKLERNDVDLIEMTAKPRVPFAVGTDVGIPSVRYLDPNSPSAKLHKSLSQQFPDSFVHFINFTDDGSKLLFSVRNDRDPGSYFLYDQKAGTADLLFAVAPHIEPELMSERRPIRFKSRDGKDIDGYLTYPKNADLSKGKLPLIVHPHGGPYYVADEWYFDSDSQFLASRGYAVLQVNFRGSNGHGLNFRSIGYRQWGADIQNDIIDGVKFVIGQGEIDAKRICSYGASFGGYSALMLTIRAPELFKCAVGYAGVYDLSYLYDEPRTKANKRSLAQVKRFVGEDQEELTRFSPSKQADKVKVPVFLVHGGKDEIAPIEHAKRMRAALIKAGNTPEWLEEPDEGHGFYDKQRRLELYQKMEAFFAKHIGK